METISSCTKFGCKGGRWSCGCKGIGEGGNLKDKHVLMGTGRLQKREREEDLVFRTQRREFIPSGSCEGGR